MGQDTIRVEGNFGITGIINNPSIGNKTSILQSDFSHSIGYKKTNYLLSGDYKLSYSNAKKTQDDASLLIQPKLILNKWNIFSFLQLVKAYSRKLDIRYESAIGTGYHLYKSTTFNLGLSYAILYDQSSYNDDSVSTRIFRHSIRLKVFGCHDKFEYFGELYFQPKIGDNSSYNYRERIELKCHISKYLSVVVIYTESYESFIVYGNNLVSNLTFGVKINY